MEVQLPVLLENHDRKINQPTSGHQPNQRTDMRGHREVTHTHHKINILAYIFTYTTTEKHNTHTQTLTHTHTLHTPESIVYPETGRLIILSLSHHTSPLHTHTTTLASFRSSLPPPLPPLFDFSSLKTVSTEGPYARARTCEEVIVK